MLLHRLPLDPTLLCSGIPDDTRFESAELRKVDLRSRARLLRASDLACVTALCWVTVLPMAKTGLDALSAGLGLSAISLAICLAAASMARLYSPGTLQTGVGHVARAVLVLGASLWPAIICAIAGAGAAAPMRTMLAGSAVILAAVAARVLCQASIAISLKRGACLQRLMVLAETVAAARFLAAEIERRTAGRKRAAVCAAIPELPGGAAGGWAEHVARSGGIDRVLIADSANTHFLLADTHHRFRLCGVEVTILYDALAGRENAAAPDDGLATDLLVLRHPLSDAQAVAKRCLDIFVAATVLFLLAPVLLAIALAIQIDSPGPIFFRQKRAGLHGTIFLMWKFRTMYVHLQDNAAQQQTRRHDDRVTRVGRLLRRISLDELPQLLNVLKGDMSIVGPRPHAIGMTVAGRAMDDLAHGYADRHRMKPGITGWAQVNGCRGELDEARKLRRRIALDCYYIENWSLMTDITIMARTAALLFADRHAY